MFFPAGIITSKSGHCAAMTIAEEIRPVGASGMSRNLAVASAVHKPGGVFNKPAKTRQEEKPRVALKP